MNTYAGETNLMWLRLCMTNVNYCYSAWQNGMRNRWKMKNRKKTHDSVYGWWNSAFEVFRYHQCWWYRNGDCPIFIYYFWIKNTSVPILNPLQIFYASIHFFNVLKDYVIILNNFLYLWYQEILRHTLTCFNFSKNHLILIFQVKHYYILKNHLQNMFNDIYLYKNYHNLLYRLSNWFSNYF